MPALMLYSRAVLDREIYCLRMACLLLYHAFMLVIVDPILYSSKWFKGTCPGTRQGPGTWLAHKGASYPLGSN